MLLKTVGSKNCYVDPFSVVGVLPLSYNTRVMMEGGGEVVVSCESKELMGKVMVSKGEEIVAVVPCLGGKSKVMLRNGKVFITYDEPKRVMEKMIVNEPLTLEKK